MRFFSFVTPSEHESQLRVLLIMLSPTVTISLRSINRIYFAVIIRTDISWLSIVRFLFDDSICHSMKYSIDQWNSGNIKTWYCLKLIPYHSFIHIKFCYSLLWLRHVIATLVQLDIDMAVALKMRDQKVQDRKKFLISDFKIEGPKMQYWKRRTWNINKAVVKC